MKLTKELLQERIDHYGAVSSGEDEVGRKEMAFFFMGKREAYINLINELYPELEGKRVFPLDEERMKETIDFIIGLHNATRK